MFELVPNGDSPIVTFSQLNGLHFLGPIRGVLPIGPNGIPILDNDLDPSPFLNPEISGGMTSYEYTFNLQGLISNISCSYETTTPMVYGGLTNYTLEYDVPSCAALGERVILTGVPSYAASWNESTNTLMAWACQSATNDTQAPFYIVYLTSFANTAYGSSIGNTTCTVSPLQPAIFPVTYRSTTNTFSTGAVLPVNESGVYSSSVFSSMLVNYTFISLTAEISEGQNFASNLFAELVVDFGANTLALAPYVQNYTYLLLYAQMIQGILEYEVCPFIYSTFQPSSLFWQTSSIRLLYSLNATPPASCIRTVAGSVTYETTGWFVKRSNIGFLIPYTLINLIALFALVQAVTFAKQNGYPDPFQPRDVQYDPIFSGEIPPEWKDKVYAIRLSQIIPAL